MFIPPNKKIRSNFRTGRGAFLDFPRGTRLAVPPWYRPSSGRMHWPIYVRRPGGRKSPPVFGSIGFSGAILGFPILFGAPGAKLPRSPRPRTTERRRGARLPPRIYTRPVVLPPCRGPVALALRALSRPFLARVPGRAIAGVRVIRGFFYSFWGAGRKSGRARVVAANLRRRAEARREAAPAHFYTSHGAAAVLWTGRVGPKSPFSAVLSAGPGSRHRGRSRY
jgi:hypothetical protein